MLSFYSGNSSLDKHGNTYLENLISSVWYLNPFSGFALPLNIMFLASPCKFVNAVHAVFLSRLQTDFDILFKLSSPFSYKQKPKTSVVLLASACLAKLTCLCVPLHSLCLYSEDLFRLVLDSVFTIAVLLCYVLLPP